MVKTSDEIEKEFVETAEEKTGRSLQDWLALIKSTGIENRNEILEWLKSQGLNFLQSQLIAGIYLNNGGPVYHWKTT